MHGNSKIIETLIRLKSSMIDYMPHASYTESDVEKCINIITDYLKKMEVSDSKEQGLLIVKNTVISLNKLNENLEHELIETGQREDIAEIIIVASSLKGYNSVDEDVTEEWREW